MQHNVKFTGVFNVSQKINKTSVNFNLCKCQMCEKQLSKMLKK